MTGFEHDPQQPGATGGPAFGRATRAFPTTGTGQSPQTAFAPTGDFPPPFPPPPLAQAPFAQTPFAAQPPEPRRKRHLGLALVVAGTIAASAAAGGVAGALAKGSSGTSSAAATSVTSPAVNTPVSVKDTTPTTAVGAVAKAVLPSVVQVTVQTYQGTSLGSGVILGADGLILTNNHVIADAANGNGQLTVTFNDGRKAQATIVGSDSGSDLAVIKATGVSGLKAATLGDSDSVQIGDTVVAIGSPDNLQGTVTSGIVSALNRQVTVSSSASRFGGGTPVTYKAIQTDASLNPGNSGGPLLNTAGQVIGINSAIYSPVSAQGGQGGSVGLGFSIPVNQVKSIIGKLEGGSVS